MRKPLSATQLENLRYTIIQLELPLKLEELAKAQAEDGSLWREPCDREDLYKQRCKLQRELMRYMELVGKRPI